MATATSANTHRHPRRSTVMTRPKPYSVQGRSSSLLLFDDSTYQPTEVDLFRLISDIHNKHEILLADLAKDLHGVTSTIRYLESQHESASIKARHSAWRHSQSSSSRIAQNGLLEDEVDRAISTLAEDEVRVRAVRVSLRNLLRSLRLEDSLDVVPTPMSMSMLTSASTVSESLERAYEMVAEKLTRWRIHDSAQEHASVDSRLADLRALDDDYESSTTDEETDEGDTDENCSSGASVFSPVSVPTSNTTITSDPSNVKSNSVRSVCNLDNPGPQTDTASPRSILSRLRSRPTSTPSYSTTSSSRHQQQPQNTITSYFTPSRKSSMLLSSHKRTRSDDDIEPSPPLAQCKKKRRKNGTLVTTAPQDVLAAAERVTRVRRNVKHREAVECFARGENRSTGCE